MIRIDDDSKPKPILPIKLKNIDMNKLQSIKTSLEDISAEEFLSYVHLEASVLPNVSKVNLATINVPNRQNIYIPLEENKIPDCPDGYLPCSSWEDECIQVFELLRETIQKLANVKKYKERLIIFPAMKDEKNWMTFCLGIKNRRDHEKEENVNEKKLVELDIDANNEDENDIVILLKRKRAELEGESTTESEITTGEDVDISIKMQKQHQSIDNDEQIDITVKEWSTYKPTLRLLLQMDQVLCQTLLRHHISWLESSYLTTNRTQWLYALMTLSEEPFSEATVAALRQLYRRCCHLRVNLDLSSSFSLEVTTKTTDNNHNNHNNNEVKDQDGEERVQKIDSVKDILAQLNLIIVITGKYFKQGEYYSNFT